MSERSEVETFASVAELTGTELDNGVPADSESPWHQIETAPALDCGTAAAPQLRNPTLGLATRMLDIVGSLALLLFLFPVMLVVAIAIYVVDPGPVIFAHRRIGLNGRSFLCFKFRTMYVGAEERLRDLLRTQHHLRMEWERDHKLARDPRITRIGAFLRISSLDELPQLFNVLCGEMSLVGPRPIVSAEVPRYGRFISSYYAVKPGLTGLWQVTGRSSTTYRRRVAADIVYVRAKCFSLDLRILAATVPAVISCRGSS